MINGLLNLLRKSKILDVDWYIVVDTSDIEDEIDNKSATGVAQFRSEVYVMKIPYGYPLTRWLNYSKETNQRFRGI